jgi:multiple sugar transport system permease protein
VAQASARLPAESSLAQHRGAIERREGIWFFVFIGPWLVGFVLLVMGPMLASLVLSFTEYQVVTPPKWIGIGNYQTLLNDKLFLQSLKVTAYYTLLSVPLSVLFAIMIAMLLNQSVPLRSIWRTIYYLPSITPGVAVALMWSWIFQPNFGLVNVTLYSLLGIQGPRWLLDAQWVVPTFVLMGLWGFGGPMLIYLAAMQGIPTDLYEAAEIDGANRLRQIFTITIPMITPVIFFNLVMNLIGSFQVFTNAYIITQGGPNYASYFYVLYLFDNAFKYFRMGFASAQAWILFVIVMTLTLIAFRSQRYWVYYESAPRDEKR